MLLVATRQSDCCWC